MGHGFDGWDGPGGLLGDVSTPPWCAEGFNVCGGKNLPGSTRGGGWGFNGCEKSEAPQQLFDAVASRDLTSANAVHKRDAAGFAELWLRLRRWRSHPPGLRINTLISRYTADPPRICS